MSYSKRERDDYNMHRTAVCEALGITVNQYNYLRRLGDQLHTIYENDCNGLYESEGDSTKAENEVCILIINYLSKLMKGGDRALYYHLQTDPRGATLYIDTKPIPANNYTSAYCIY